MWFDYIIKCVPDKSLHITDTLSLAPLKQPLDSNKQIEMQEVEYVAITS